MTPPHRFIARAGRTKHPLLLVYGLVLGFVALGVTSLAIPAAAGVLKPVMFGLLLVGGLGVILLALVPRRLELEVAGGGLTVGGGREGVFPRDGMTIEAWHLPMHRVPQGVALRCVAGDRSFRVGGRDVRPPSDAPASDRVDAYLDSAAFEALLEQLRVPRWPASARCLLAPNGWAMRPRAPLLAVELGDVVRVIELATERGVGSAPRSAVTVQRGAHVSTGRMSFQFLVLSVTLPGMAPLTISTPDPRFTWRDEPARVAAARYVCGGPDWLLLVSAFELDAAHATAASM